MSTYHTVIGLIFLIAALVCFGLAAMELASRLNLLGLGLFFVTLYLAIGPLVAIT